jgi:hypothetical protein
MTLGVYMAKNMSRINGRISVTMRISALHADVTQKKCSGWKPTHLTSVFSLQTSIFTWPHGTMLTAFADGKFVCLRMLARLVSTHPKKCFILQPWKRMKLVQILHQKENVSCYTLEGKCFVENILGVGCFIRQGNVCQYKRWAKTSSVMVNFTIYICKQKTPHQAKQTHQFH